MLGLAIAKASFSGSHMLRRAFITLLGGAAATWPLASRAQQPAKMKRIAIVHPSDRVADMSASYRRSYRGFFDELNRLGFVEGKNLVVERYSGGGQPERFAQLASYVVDTRPDAIYSMDGYIGSAFKAATTTIPIVTVAGDPVVIGLVSNIARPGGNVTGTANSVGLEIWGKRIGLLKGDSSQTVQSLRHRVNTRTLGRSLRLGNPSGGQSRKHWAEYRGFR